MDRSSNRVVAAALALTLTAGVVYSGPAQGSTAVAPMPRSAVGVDLGFSAHLHDATSGLILARARVLDPLTGAFLQRDPNGYQDSVNQYAYGANDPVNRRDPTGRIAPLILAGLAIAGGALATYVTPAGIDTPNPNQAYADNALFIMAGVSKWLLPIAGLVGLQSDVETGHGMDLVAVGGAGAAISGGVSSAARALSFGPGISSAVNEAFASYARESSGPGFWAAEEVAAASAGPLKNLSGSLDDAAAKARGVYPVPGAPGPAPRLPDFNGPWRDVPDNFRWGNYLKRLLGDGPPAGMFDPHAHHILFKEGNGAAQQSLVSEGQAILRNQAGIDPIFGQENLVWAPNGVPGQHGPEALEAVLLRLRALNAANASPEAYRQALRELGQTAASRTR